MFNSKYGVSFKKDMSPLERAELAARILSDGCYNEYKDEFKEFLYPGPFVTSEDKDNAADVIFHLKDYASSDPKIADAIWTLGKTGEPFKPEYDRKTWEHELFSACVDSLLLKNDEDELRDRFVDLVFNPLGNRSKEDCEKLSSFLKELQESYNKSFRKIVAEVLCAPNWYLKSLHLDPKLDCISSYFLYDQRKEKEYTDGNNFYCVRRRQGFGLIEISKGKVTTSEAHLFSIDYYFKDEPGLKERLVASIDFERNHISLYGKNKITDLVEQDFMTDDRYTLIHSDEVVRYKGFSRICNDFAFCNNIVSSEPQNKNAAR